MVAGEASAEGGADGAGEDGEGDVEVDVEGDGPGEGVGVEGPDGFGEALFDVHPAGVSLDELFDAGGAVVGDDDGRGVPAESGDDELPDGAGVVRQGGGFVRRRGVVGICRRGPAARL